MNDKVYCIYEPGARREELLLCALEKAKGILPNKIEGNIVIKPNFLSCNFLEASTHPISLEVVLKFFRQKYPQNKIIVAEGSHVVEDYVKKYNIYKMVALYDASFFSVNAEERWTEFELLDLHKKPIITRFSKTVYNAGYLVSLSLPKTHGNIGLTSCEKNLVGCLHNNDRCHIHGLHDKIPEYEANQYRRHIYDMDSVLGRVAMNVRGLFPLTKKEKRSIYYGAKLIGDNLQLLYYYKRPDLSIIDGYSAMEGNGPWHGKKIMLYTDIISSNVVAADILMAEIMNMPIKSMGYISDNMIDANHYEIIYDKCSLPFFNVRRHSFFVR